MKKLVLLLPSAVNPPSSMPFLTLRDEDARLKQTIRALKYWSRFQNHKSVSLRVVIGDNTGGADQLSMNCMKFFAPGNLTVMDVPPPAQETINRGKGAAETSAMLYMLQNYSFEAGDTVGKMTGRQICTNAIDIFESLETRPKFAAWPRPNLETVDSRFYLGDPDYLLDILRIIYEETDDIQGLFVEELYARHCLWKNRGGFELFKYEPAILGQAGTTGTKLSPLSEANLIAVLVKLRKWLRKNVSFIQPKYVRLNRKIKP